MGEHPRPGTEHSYKYRTLLRLSDDRPVTIYADMSDGLRSIYIPQEMNHTSEVKSRLTLPQPTSKFCFSSQDSFIYSKAALEDVSQIRICGNEERITGMLLGYSNGTWASLGSVDVNQLRGAMHVDAAGLWIQSAYTEGPPWVTTRAHIVCVTSRSPTSGHENSLHVRWHGELEWWYSKRQCEVHYGDKHTLPVL
ncbi:hypothetical protein LEL_10553 [Akanthomyces lecanii RCEF 1005]|uniref:Uncharacterized protein n=1 Tax=Akanthomyces lecanii RCEF 1005 TaxID=1081108 RepID=A0A167XL13_CORDF|nr:hypothetical protein LEL_10553 [Akanthomyces lecanii RCEF 1005]